MQYINIVKGKFVSRPNRFVAKVEINGQIETVHVKNTGRCRELLIPDAEVYLEKSDNPLRKTLYDLVVVRKKCDDGKDILINMDSQIPNAVAEEWIKSGALFGEDAKIRREVRYGDSRFDLFVEKGEKRAFVEVKGVTLESDGVAMFPDAPTERGVKHINGLVSAVDDGFDAYILFIVQMKDAKSFCPNDVMHKEFGDALRRAKSHGVRIVAVCCYVSSDSISVSHEIPVVL